MNVIQKALFLLGNDRKKLPRMILAFVIMSFIDVVGIGLMGPYVSFIMDSNLQSTVTELLKPVFGKELKNSSAIIIVGAVLFIFFLFRAIAGISVNAIVIGFSESQRYRLKLHLLDVYQRMGSEDSNKRNTAEYIQNIHILTGHYSANFIFFLLKLASEGILCLFLISLLAYQSIGVVISLIVLIGLVVGGWDLFAKPKLKLYGREINRYSGEALSLLRESLDGYQEIRILGKTKDFHDRFAQNSMNLVIVQRVAAIFNSVPKYLLELTIFVFVILLCTFSFLFVDEFSDFIPLITVFGVASVRLIPSATVIAHSIVCIRHNSNTVNLLYDDYIDSHSQNKLQDSNTTKEYIIDEFKKLEIKNLSFSYNNQDKKIFNNASLTIEAGQAIGIIGASGAGKSTLIDLIIGLLDASSGSIEINSKSLDVCKKSWQSHIAIIPQQIFLLDESIAINISFEFDTEKIDNNQLIKALKMASLADFVESLPMGVETKIGEKGAFLSGGQKQRIILARAFYHNRKFLILDEATSSLDSNTETKIVNEIIALKEKITMVVIAHRLSTIEHCDHIFKIAEGKISYQK